MEELQMKKRFVGPAILAYLESKGISQAWLARKIGKSRATLHAMLHSLRDINAEEYFNICNALEVPVSTFESERKKEGGAA